MACISADAFRLVSSLDLALIPYVAFVDHICLNSRFMKDSGKPEGTFYNEF